MPMAARPAKKKKKVKKNGKAHKAAKAANADDEPTTEADEEPATSDDPPVKTSGKQRKAKKGKASEGIEAGSPEKQSRKTKKKRKAKLKEGKDSTASTAAPASESEETAAKEGSASAKRQAEDVAVPPKKKIRTEGNAIETQSTAAAATATAAPPAAAYRATHKIQVRPGCPEPFQSFRDAELHMGRFLIESLRDQGYTNPTPIQAQAWPIIIKGEDVVAVSKTGSGKTCAFLLPALVRIARRQCKAQFSEDKVLARPTTVVVTPTRELAQQIEVEGDKFADAVGARVVSIFGGVPKGEQLRDLKRGVDILVTTPGRVLDFVAGNSTRELGPVISLKSCSYLVLDEADKMLDMGFEKDVRKILLHCMKGGTPEEVLQGTRRQTLFFTATWPKTVHQVAAYFTNQKAWHIRIGQNLSGTLTADANIKQKVFVVSQAEKQEKLKHILSGTLKHGETALVFAMTKKTCDILEKELTWDPLKPGPILCGWCKSIHGDKEQPDRDKILDTFRQMTADPNNKHKGVLVATDVAARGLDIPGVALVVIYDMSDGKMKATESGMEAYVHRVGRTGRAGRAGKAVAFFTPDDRGAGDLVKMLRDCGQEVSKSLEDLASRNELFENDARGKGKGRGHPNRSSNGKGKGKGKGPPRKR